MFVCAAILVPWIECMSINLLNSESILYCLRVFCLLVCVMSLSICTFNRIKNETLVIDTSRIIILNPIRYRRYDDDTYYRASVRQRKVIVVKKWSVMISIVVLIITVALYFGGLQDYIGFLPILLVNSTLVFIEKESLSKKQIFFIVMIALTIILQIVALLFQLDDIISILSLLLNSIVCICFPHASKRHQ